MKISIIVPVYNSQGILAELNSRVQKALKDIKFELIFIDDGSQDNSWRSIKKLSESWENIVGISLRKNAGQDNAIMAGLNVSRGEYLVIMDDDLQHSPFDILTLISGCREGYDVCYALFKNKRQAIWKNIGSWINGKFAEIMLHKPPHIYLSPFLAFTKSVRDEIIKYKGPYPYVQGLILNVTNKVTQKPISHYKRHSGNGNFGIIKSLRVFLKLVTSFSVVPLRFATIVGFTCSLMGFVLVPVYIYDYLTSGKIVEGWTTLVLINLIIGGLLLFSIGLIGEYIGRMYLLLNLKPQYVVKEKIGARRSSKIKIATAKIFTD